MVSLTTNSIHLLVSRYSFTDLNTNIFAPCVCLINPRTRVKKQENFGSLSLVAAKESGSVLGFLEFKRKGNRDSFWLCGGFVRRCKKGKGWDSEVDIALEAEILEFMKNSEKPEAFPSKRELMDGGRMDLVEAIVKQGGWLASGWDLDDEAEEEKGLVRENGFNDWDLIMEKECDNGAFQERNEAWSSAVPYLAVNSSSSLASSSGRSLEAAAEDDCGIEGILNRLEKERNTNLGLALRKKGNSDRVLRNGGKNDSLARTSMDPTAGDLQRSCRPVSLSPSRGLVNDSRDKLYETESLSGIDGLRNSLRPETWRTWSMKRAGFSERGFEAAEIAFNELGGITDVLGDETLEIEGVSGGRLNPREESHSSCEEINHNYIQSRLQCLQFELSSVLHSLRSNADEVVSEKGHESSSDDLQKLSDACEFQENKIMNSQDKLRSLRAKLAVLEGKMAVAIIDAKRIVEEKQKRADDACRALQLLRTACIVWPNSASEVLLVGSFDGWASQRKMEKSGTGVFSLWLKLYPGKYEIKFIVDGEWKIDPLRPIVHNNGYKNNLLIVT